MRKLIIIAVVVMLALFAVQAQADFKADLGNVRVGEMPTGPQYVIPYIYWGADMVTFYANGGLETKPGSIFAKQGLNIKLVAGDDFKQQVKDYEAGKLPFLRGTFSMIGMAEEVLASDAKTKGVCFIQLSWSTGGDCFVIRGDIKTVKDLKGKTIVLQKDGPHVGFLDDVLKMGQLSWDDIKVIWVADINGKNGPAEYFSKHPEVDGAFCVSPDMATLTGGLTKVGDGREGTIKGARVLVSTAEMTHSIADVYVSRKDFYDRNKDWVVKFTAGYMKACEEVIELKKKYEQDPKGSPEYVKLLQMTQTIYGKDSIPTLEDAHGLLSDCTLVGYPGNVAFFTEKSNMHGFEATMKSVLDMALNRGYTGTKTALFASGLDYESDAFLKYLTKIEVKRTDKFNAEVAAGEIETLTATGGLGERTINSFTIGFKSNQKDFSAEEYGLDFERVIRDADKAGGAVMVVRGHADPTLVLKHLINAGVEKGILQRTGNSTAGYKYFFKGAELNINNTKQIVDLIETGEFDAQEWRPREVMQSALNLSKQRAEAVRKSLVEFAKSKGMTLDLSQVQAVGAGIREPIIARPRNTDEAEQNMRVEFRLVRVSAEASKKSDFDY